MSLNKKSKQKLHTQTSSPQSRPKRLVSLSSKKLNTMASSSVIPLRKQHLRYDTSLFHQTIFHMKPMIEDPELFERDHHLSSKAMGTLKYWRPQRPSGMKVGMKQTPNRDNMLLEVTLSHVTARKWVIYNMKDSQVIKGYKYRMAHDVASLSKLLTFYTAYQIIKEFFIGIGTFDIMVTPTDNKVGGTMLSLNPDQDTLMTLEEALYAIMLTSANNVAMAVANNLGSYINKKKDGLYFSCFDLSSQSRDENVRTFVGLMRQYAKLMGLKNTLISNPHGISGNTSSAMEIAKIASQCFKIPFFSKVTSTEKYIVHPREVDEDGQLIRKAILCTNSNRLLGEGCLGGKTGCNVAGGDSFAGYWEGGVMIVVLGSAGRTEKFTDSLRLIEWVRNKLKAAQLFS